VESEQQFKDTGGASARLSYARWIRFLHRMMERVARFLLLSSEDREKKL
jgi:hypothetical protein